MARYLYVNSDQANGVIVAAGLGCGWIPAVPPEFASTATAPCAIVSGGGQAVVFPDDGALTSAKIQNNAGVQAITAAEQAVAQAQATQQGNQAILQQQAGNALAANRTDQTQDASIISGAATINGTAGTFTLAQCTTFIKQLAQACSTLAQNDTNAKKELSALIRLTLQQFDATN